jgi:hypothetical protein
MPNERNHGRPELGLEELRRLHLDDAPSGLERARLMARVLEYGAVPEQRPRSIRRHWPAALALTTVAASLGVLAWQRSLPGIHPEPSTQLAALDSNSPAASLSLAPHPVHPSPVATQPSPRLCNLGRGDAGLLADFEQPLGVDRLLPLPQLDQRRGQWFHSAHDPKTDSRSLPLLLEPQRLPTTHNRSALHVKGEAKTGWGANVGFRFASCYDASAYGGLEFRARGPGSVFVAFQTVSSVPVEFGGECRDKCWFNGGRFIVLSKNFETYRIRWSEMNTPDGHAVEESLLQVMFSIQSGTSYDFWLDDVSFFARQAANE